MPTAFAPQQMGFTIGQVGLNLSLAFALSYLAATLYRKLYAGPSYCFSFFLTLIVTPVVVAMIMMAIGSNIALSLGLVGALSIIRFRTVIKDTRDMSFLFLMIGIGLCCGAGAYPLAIMGAGFVCFVLTVMHYIPKSRHNANEYILVFRQDASSNGEVESALTGLVSWRELHGACDLGEEGGCEYTYRVRLASTTTPEQLMHRLKSIEGLRDSTLISPESQVAI